MRLATPVLWLSLLTSQHLNFQFPITSLLKFFVRSRRDWKKKCREGSRQLCFGNNEAAQFHFLEYKNRNQIFILDSRRPFIAGTSRKEEKDNRSTQTIEGILKNKERRERGPKTESQI